MKKLFFLLACVAMSMLAMGQNNQLVWANGRLLYGSPITNVDSLTYDEVAGMDTLLLPRVLIKEVVKEVHDTVYVTQIVHDTVYVETDCGDEDDTPSAGIGVFSVSADKQVTFSKGNLQYHPANDEWRFAEHQWDYIGDANDNISSTYNGWLDLFAWGTGNNPTYVGIYNYYRSFVDWGTNQIGSDAPNTWRTLTRNEWEYLLETRPNASSLKGIAQVNGVNGLIFLPDNWTCPSGVTFKSGFHSSNGVDYYAAYQTFTADQWLKLEMAGAIFLPAAGERFNLSSYSAKSYGTYWSATMYDTYYAYFLKFHSDEAYMIHTSHFLGRSVRLVKDL